MKKIIKHDNIVCFDVDETLIFEPGFGSMGEILQTPYGFKVRVLPIERHIKLLKKYYNQGRFIIVWSASGYEWVETVIKHLRLKKYVSIMMTKPLKYVDDLNANKWMKRVYLK